MRPWTRTDDRWRPWARTLVPVLVVAGVFVAGAPPAMAHASLRGSQPAVRWPPQPTLGRPRGPAGPVVPVAHRA